MMSRTCKEIPEIQICEHTGATTDKDLALLETETAARRAELDHLHVRADEIVWRSILSLIQNQYTMIPLVVRYIAPLSMLRREERGFGGLLIYGPVVCGRRKKGKFLSSARLKSENSQKILG